MRLFERGPAKLAKIIPGNSSQFDGRRVGVVDQPAGVFAVCA